MGAGPLSTGPLAGIKVMDLAWVVAGPVIGRALADFGATVIRVESSRRVETARLMGPFPEGKMNTQRSALYDNCNTNKLGLSLDLSQEPARAVARDLARWADVVIESFMPGQMARFGLDYESLRRTNPSLIMVSTSLMGQTGPHANLAGYGNIGAALSGYQMIVGAADEMPVGPFGPYTDYVGPRFSLVTLLAALDHRRRTGAGCLIDVSQAEAGIAFLAPQIADYCVSGRVVRAQGNRDAAFAPHGVFRAAGKDSWVAIVARDDSEWRALAAIVGGEQLARDARFVTLAARKDNEDSLEERVGAWTATREASAIEVQLQGAGIPAYVVASTDEFVSDSQLKSQGHIRSLPHPLGGESVFEAARYQLSSTPPVYQRSAPHFGRDNDLVLGQILGYDAERIASLQDCGALV
jgi:crotonobetainyl-CoA:carnitine CoA-transferase CaiB-like acyl-CoA transferase